MQAPPLNMQRKPGFPAANCSIKMPDGLSMPEPGAYEEDHDQQQRRQQLINFGHDKWGFNHWSWAVTKQELDFVELSNGKYCAGVVAFVSVTVKSLDIHRENIGYATSNANTKGFAIYKSRKCAVTNALKETLLSFGGNVATDLLELLESHRELPTPVTPHVAPVLPHVAPVPPHVAPINPHGAPVPPHGAPLPSHVASVPPIPPEQENNQNIANKMEPKNVKNIRKDDVPQNMRAPPVKNAPNPVERSPPVARACPMPGPRAPPGVPRAPAPRPNSNDAKLENMSEEEARAERKRRQRIAQEEFRLKQLMKNNSDSAGDGSRNSSVDQLLLQIPSQDIEGAGGGKRRSPGPHSDSKRHATCSKHT